MNVFDKDLLTKATTIHFERRHVEDDEIEDDDDDTTLVLMFERIGENARIKYTRRLDGWKPVVEVQVGVGGYCVKTKHGAGSIELGFWNSAMRELLRRTKVVNDNLIAAARKAIESPAKLDASPSLGEFHQDLDIPEPAPPPFPRDAMDPSEF